ncbi:hypothetical protein [Pseudonocardia asaccharolytica]|nr:hypothetical protein [Pseudonocardia asaccharolytica]
MNHTRLVSAALLSTLVAALALGWAAPGKAGPMANRGWNSGSN